MPHTSVVIVSFQPGEWLRRCLESVLHQADEVILVDNGSPNSGAKTVASQAGAQPVVLDRNRGFAGGVNAGLAACRGEIVALLNDDAFAEPDWLKRSVAALDDDVAAVSAKLLFEQRYVEIGLDDEPHYDPPDPRPLGRHLVSLTLNGEDVLAGALGPGIHRLEKGPPGPPRWRWTAGSGAIYLPVPAGTDRTDVLCNGEAVPAGEVVDLLNNAGSYLSAEGYGGDYGYETPDRGAFDAPADRFAACGAAMVMRADTLRRIGPFAEHFFAYYEDTDWCWRAQLAGLRVRYEPTAVVRHMGGATTGGPERPFVRRLAFRNRLATLARNAPLPVLRRQLARARHDEGWPDVRLSVAKGLAREAPRRAALMRRRARTPADIWARWAGTDEHWPASGRHVELT
jgi:GT2 family glycosyltransferase